MTMTLSPLPVGTAGLTYAQAKGRILAFREQNLSSDSYFHALIAFDAPDGGYTFGWRETGATAYAGGFIGRPDCTEPRIRAAYEARRTEVLDAEAERRAQEALRMVEPGKAVTIVTPPTRGKNKVPPGTPGTVLKRTVNAFDSGWAQKYGHRTYRVQVDTPHGALWLDESRVRVAGFEEEDLPLRDSAIDYVIAQSWPPLQKVT